MTERYEVKDVSDKHVWEQFLLQFEHAPFLQSWNSAEQFKKNGEVVYRLGLYQDSVLVGIALIAFVSAKRGKYLYIPYGPILKSWQPEAFSAFVKHIRSIAEKHGCWFIRVAPFVQNTDENNELFSKNGFNISPIHLLAETLWVLDLDKSEQELLANMRKTTRNLIRRAQKDKVLISSSTSEKETKEFTNLLEETSKRHEFVRYSDKLLNLQVQEFKEDNEVLVFSAHHQKELLAGAIVMYYGDTAFYHHGASVKSKVPAPYLLQWEAIKEAQKRGCKRYNFWGIEESNNPKHPFYGLTHFKLGFGGHIIHLLPCQDLPLSSKYFLTYIIETIRRIKRGFGLKRK